MNHFVREIFPDYDLHKRTGIPESLTIPPAEVAAQILIDVVARGKFLQFVTLLIAAQDEGFMGRRYPITNLREIIKGTYEMGYMFDSVNKMFVEDPRYRKTRNWGVLEVGEEYMMTLLRIDIVGNSNLVRKYPAEIINKTYTDLRRIVSEAITKRNGRIWSWEGDGGLAAFHFGDKHRSVTLSAMEIIHDLFVYNRIKCPLDDPLKVRIGVHSGICEYTASTEELEKMETFQEVDAIQRKAKPSTASVSIVVKVMLDEFIASRLAPVDKRKNTDFRYSLSLG